MFEKTGVMRRYRIYFGGDCTCVLLPSPVENSVNFVAPLKKDAAMSRLDVRKAALESVQARASGKNGSGRMKGKVGIITGVGPELGIGVGACSPILLGR